jgi:hypothetical protein
MHAMSAAKSLMWRNVPLIERDDQDRQRVHYPIVHRRSFDSIPIVPHGTIATQEPGCLEPDLFKELSYARARLLPVSVESCRSRPR